MKLSQEIRQQQKAVQEFRDAIEVIEQRPKFEPQNNEPLAFLKEQMSAASSEADRAQKLQQAKAALAYSENVLAELLAEWEAKRSAADEAAKSIELRVEKFNETAAAFAAAAEELRLELQQAEPILRQGESLSDAQVLLSGAKNLLEVKPIAIQQGSTIFITTEAALEQQAASNRITQAMQSGADVA